MSTLPSPAPRFSKQQPLDIDLHGQALTVQIPSDHIGEVVIPGTGRRVWWTGRVAIGLRYQPAPHADTPSSSALWVQDLLLQASARRSADG